MARKRERGNGDGDVWPRKNKQGKIIGYRASYWVDTPSGPKRRYLSGKNKGETRAALNKAKSGREDGFLTDAGTPTLGNYLDSWLEDTRGTVRERYEQIVRVHIKPTLGRAKLKTLNPAQVRALYRERLEGGSSPRTVQYVHVTLHKALEQAQGDGLVACNAAKGIKAPRPRNRAANAGSGPRVPRSSARGQVRGPVRPGPALWPQGGRAVGPEVGRR
jgi:integrase